MAVLESEPLIIEDERSKAIMFALMSEPHGAFQFADMLRWWFNRDVRCLAGFLAWLDAHDLEIRKKQ